MTGGIDDRNDIGLPPGDRPADRGGGSHALELFKTKIGLRFDAGPEA